MRVRTLLVPFAAAFLALMIACAPSPRFGVPGKPGGALRIGLLEGVPSVTIECSDQMRVTVGPGMLSGTSFQVTSGGTEAVVTGGESNARASKIDFAAGSPIRVNGVGYRGQIEVLQTTSGLTIVNEVGLEDYLKGVVPREIGYLGPDEIEAMKAQAIAARTYTVSHIGRRASHGFDLYADTRDQVYGGVPAESDEGDKAVDDTRGLVILYHGAYIEAFFHSTCGGETANIEDVWDSPPLPYLRRVYDADDKGFNCKDSRHFRWVEVYTAAQAQATIAAHLSDAIAGAPHDIGRLKDVEVDSTSLSGRAQWTRIVTDKGTWEVPKEKIREVLRRPIDGAPPLRSSYIRIFDDFTPDGHVARLVVSGAGNGHGVGMCQWGAIGMARKGYTCDQILKHYYTGVDIANYRTATVATAMTLAPAGEG